MTGAEMKAAPRASTKLNMKVTRIRTCDTTSERAASGVTSPPVRMSTVESCAKPQPVRATAIPVRMMRTRNRRRRAASASVRRAMVRTITRRSARRAR